MEVFFADAADDLLLFLLVDSRVADGAGQKSQMGNLQNAASAGTGQAFGGQLQNLIDAVFVNLSDGLQPHLHDFLEAAAALRDPVDVFVIVELADARIVPGVFHNGEGHVRL